MASKLDRWKQISVNNSTSVENPNKAEIVDKIATLPSDDAKDVRLKNVPESGVDIGNTPTIPESSSENENNKSNPEIGIQNRNIIQEDTSGINSGNKNQEPDNDSVSENKNMESDQSSITENTKQESINDSKSKNKNNIPKSGVNKKNKNKESDSGINNKNTNSESTPGIDSKNINHQSDEGIRNENQHHLEEDEGDSDHLFRQDDAENVGLAHRVSGNVLHYVQNKVTKEMTHKKTSFMASLTNLAKLELFDNAHGGRVKGEFLNSLLEEAFAELETDPQWNKILNKDLERVIAKIRKRR